MLDITSRLKARIRDRIGIKLAAVMAAVIFMILLLLNIIPPMLVEQKLAETEREDCLVHARYLAGRGDVSGYPADETVRIMVLDSEARVVSDSSIYGSFNGRHLLIPGVRDALSDNEVGFSEYSHDALTCYALVPMGDGAVFVYRENIGALEVIKGIRWCLLSISVLILIVLGVAVGAFSLDLTRRLSSMLSGVRRVQSGAYGEQLEYEGHDELALITEELNLLSEQIQETEELRRTFVSDASHELRTPLSSIRLLTDSILQTEHIDVETTKEFMQDIGEEIDRLTRIAERLLILTRLDGADKLVLEPVDIKKTVESVVTTLEPYAEEAKVKLVTNLADGCVFRGNADGAYQILFNLIENAIKYNRPGGHVRTFLFARENTCYIIVDDNGIGIPEADYDRIFERFYRVDKARSRSGKGGTGLGLAIVAKNVANYGGTIKVSPSVEGGVRFTITFPQVQEEVG